MGTRTHLCLALLSIAFIADWATSITVSFNADPTPSLAEGNNETADSQQENRPRRLIAPPSYQYYLFNGLHRYPNVPLLPQMQGGAPRLPLLLTLAPILRPTYARVQPSPPPVVSAPKVVAPAKKQAASKGAPGRPGVDYPTYNTVPPTTFDCKTQRFKGFFADPDTQCQVWHYCDLNGGQASFLCPNGTIFSQVLLTCDWWFNVRCNSSLQAYVLNERLYKFITPHRPTFPEDFSGPQVDEYLLENEEQLGIKEQARLDRIRNKHKHNEFEDVDELQMLLDKMRGQNNR